MFGLKKFIIRGLYKKFEDIDLGKEFAIAPIKLMFETLGAEHPNICR